MLYHPQHVQKKEEKDAPEEPTTTEIRTQQALFTKAEDESERRGRRPQTQSFEFKQEKKKKKEKSSAGPGIIMDWTAQL